MEDQKQYRKARSYRNYDRTKFSQDIQEHFLYVPNLYEHDTNKIAQNLTDMIQETLDLQTPVKIIQITKKSGQKLSTEARENIAERDTAYDRYKETKNMDDLRYVKNLKNKMNWFIAKERFQRKQSKFNNENMSSKDMWKAAKEETGQINFKTPKLIFEKDVCYTQKK